MLFLVVPARIAAEAVITRSVLMLVWAPVSCTLGFFTLYDRGAGARAILRVHALSTLAGIAAILVPLFSFPMVVYASRSRACSAPF